MVTVLISQLSQRFHRRVVVMDSIFCIEMRYSSCAGALSGRNYANFPEQ